MTQNFGVAFYPGIFDRSRAGTSTPPVTVRVKRSRVRFFARALGITDPAHHDLAAARRAGHPDLLAPPSFPMVIEALAEEERSRRGQASWYDLLRCDKRFLLHGSEAYSFLCPIFAGDDVEFVTEFIGFADKKGGALEFAEIAQHLSHYQRGRLVTVRRTILHRLG